MGTVVLVAAVLFTWTFGTAGLLIGVAKLIEWAARRRREKAKAEARATAVVDPVIEPGLNLLDEAELVAAYADPSFGPDDITGGSVS